MVSYRCKLMVKNELTKLNLQYGTVELGEVEILDQITPDQRRLLKDSLKISGLELMDDKLAVLIATIKSIIIDNIHNSEDYPDLNFSSFLSQKLQLDYAHLATVFSEATGTTIERYLINHKIEKVKELLIYKGLSLTEISYRLKYSSVAHLSAQFKNETGLTPSFYKKIKLKRIKKNKK